MKTTPLSVLTMLSLGLAASACSSGSSEPVTPNADAAPTVDAGSRDAGTTPADASTADAAAPVDASAPADATTDAAAPTDASTSADAAIDAGSDATVASDASTDAGSDATVIVPDAAVDAGSPPPAGATCANAPTITPPVSATYTMDATYGNDFTSGTGCFFKSGADRVFAVDVPAQKRLYASVRGVGTYDPSIAIVDGASSCGAAATTCLSANDVGLATSLNFVAVTNSTSASKRYFVVVDGTDGGGQYDFRALIGDPLAGETCATAEAITTTNGSATLTGQTVDLYANDYTTGTGCTGFAGGERVYKLVIPANTAMAVTVTPEASFDAALNVIDGAAGANPETACAAAISCSAGANAGGAGAPERVLLRNTSAAEKTVFVTVDTAVSTSAPGSFDLAVETLPPTPGDTCANPPAVSFTNDTASFAGESIRYAFDDYGAGTGCAGTTGPERGYAVTIPAGRILTVVATASAVADGGTNTLNPAINVVDAAACGAATRTCLRGSDVTGLSERVVYANAGASPLNVVVFVETAATSIAAPGTYDVSFTLSDPPPGDVCSTAALTAPGSYTGQSLIDFANDYASGTGCSGASGPDRLYKVRVPNGQRLVATATPSSSWDPSVNIMGAAGCVTTGRTCLAGSDSAYSGAAETTSWLNGTGSDVEVYVVVETYTPTVPAAGTTRDFTLDLALEVPPPGDTCATAGSLTLGTPLADQTLIGFGNDYGSGTSCSGAGGPDRVYSVVVPAGERLEVTVTPTTPDGGTSWNPSINVMSAAQCQAATRTCLAGSDTATTGAAEIVRWTNNAATPTTVFVAVETSTTAAPAAGATRSFTISATSAPVPPPPPGDVCSDTLTLISSTSTLPSESLVGLTGDYSYANTLDCDFFSGIDRAYRVRIPAGSTLTATVTPDSTWDPTLGLVLGSATACTGSSVTCASTADIGLSGDPETVTYTNATGSAVDAFLIVDSYTTGTSATYGYSLAVTFTP